MSRLSLALTVVGLLGLATCIKTSTSTSTSPGDGATSSDPATTSGGAVDPGQQNSSPPPTSSGCLTDSECDGGVCEGLGCGDDQPGTCMPADRMCTRDSQAYCGCDGQTFRASGSCPGQRYAAKGECGGPPSGGATAADGATCLKNSDCASGICEGEGCGDDQPGTCAAKDRMCTRDYRAYCGCDGKTFRSSGSCPGQRFSSRSACGGSPSTGGA